jgi:hypothetical protein
MKKHLLGLIPLSLIVLLVSCQKDNLEGCLGCGIDTTPKEFQFDISGHLYANCQGERAPFKAMEFYISDEFNTFLGTTLTESDGSFSFTYKRILDYPYLTTFEVPRLTLLKIAEDSMTYILPGLINMENLNLYLQDSIDLDIYLDYINEPLLPADTLFYTFQPKALYGQYSTYAYKTGGPQPNHALLNQLQSRWTTVEVDKNGNPHLNVYWKVKRSTDTFVSNWFSSASSKSSCMIRKDSVAIALK